MGQSADRARLAQLEGEEAAVSRRRRRLHDQIDALRGIAPLTLKPEVVVANLEEGTELPPGLGPTGREPRRGGRWIVETDTPVWAAAPGQAAVLYDGDVVLGGGRIERPAAVDAAMLRESMVATA